MSKDTSLTPPKTTPANKPVFTPPRPGFFGPQKSNMLRNNSFRNASYMSNNRGKR